MNVNDFMNDNKVIEDLKLRRLVIWINRKRKEGDEAWSNIDLKENDIIDAEKRLERFSPLILKFFPDTSDYDGLIESELRELAHLERFFKRKSKFDGKLLIKLDSHLPIAGSIKARGGIYEVLKYAEKIALENNLMTLNSDYLILGSEKVKKFFSKYTIQVGSTGNLGLSIGIISAALGFKVIVHMSCDAKEWKKNLLREKGVIVKEYKGDFSQAVEKGRKESLLDSKSYFIDDENSTNLFLGYAVAAIRLKEQLKEMQIKVDKSHPLFVYLPCGVGGSPGGISFGLRKIMGDNVHIFFIEPVNSPCMLLGMASGLHDKISVKDIGLSGRTEADGLAVGRPSKIVGQYMETLISGIITENDDKLFEYMKLLYKKEDIKIEPSAAACLSGVDKIFNNKKTLEYINKRGVIKNIHNSTHIIWATGGGLVPEDIMDKYLNE